MTFLALWGRITGEDKRKQMPVQQAVVMGRTGDYVIVFPYGLYADLPTDAMLKEIAEGVMIPVTVDRPSDTEQGEPVFFHPATGTRIIARNNGDLDVISSANVNVTATEVNATATEVNATAATDVTVTATAGTAATVAGTQFSATAPSIYIGNGVFGQDVIALMREICEVGEAVADNNSERDLWIALRAKIGNLT